MTLMACQKQTLSRNLNAMQGTQQKYDGDKQGRSFALHWTHGIFASPLKIN
jgi:hypothetical protein